MKSFNEMKPQIIDPIKLQYKRRRNLDKIGKKRNLKINLEEFSGLESLERTLKKSNLMEKLLSFYSFYGASGGKFRIKDDYARKDNDESE